MSQPFIKMKKFFFSLLFVAFVVGCSDDSSEDNSSTDNFDRQEMLVNWADNLIIPSYTSFQGEVEVLKNASETFTENPTQEHLEALRAVYQEAYLAFQHVSMYEIGPAETINYRGFINTYPTDAEGIENTIASDSYNLELPSNRNIQGFPALDYLLYGLAESDAELLAVYSTNPNADAYKNYLTNVSQRILDLTGAVLTEWNNNYRDTFVNNTSSSNTGSVDRFTNDFIIYYEKYLRSGKVGIPAGAFSGTVQPTKVESYYHPSFSKELLKEALLATQNFFNGQSAGNSTNGASFKTYLDYLDSMKDGEQLSSLINDRFENSFQKINELDASLLQQIETDNNKMLETFDALQSNVILLKIDMLQALSISVDYVDSDGD